MEGNGEQVQPRMVPDKPSMPGGPVKMKPLRIDGKFYDPLHPPRLVKNSDGAESYVGGKELDRDTVYAQRYWDSLEPSVREAQKKVMEERIAQSAREHGTLGAFVSTEGVIEEDKAKLSAQRMLAQELGYEVGEYKINKQTGTASAPIRLKQATPLPSAPPDK